MPVVRFPDPRLGDENGLIAVGGDLEPASLLLAYSNGIFPWPISNSIPLAWFSPDPRGVLAFKNLHISRSFKKFLEKTELTVTFNRNFEDVIRGCANAHHRRGTQSTWITEELIFGYCQLFKMEKAYSVEVWLEKNLVGGLYGVCHGSFISGESMFYEESGASKLALYSLIQRLSHNGIQWIDTQMVTPVVKAMGGEEISQERFLSQLAKCDFEKSRREIFNSLTD